MYVTKNRKYDFKNSLTLRIAGILLSLIVPFLFIYFIGFYSNRKLSIFVIILGVLNFIYYFKDFLNRKIILTIDLEGIKTQSKEIKWEKIKCVKFETTYSGKRRAYDELVIQSIKDKEIRIDVSNIDLTEKKLKEIIGSFKKNYC